MSNLVFCDIEDTEISLPMVPVFKFIMPSETKITTVNNTLVSKFEQIGVTERRRKSIPILRMEYVYTHLTTEEMLTIQNFFDLSEIEWQKGSFWLPVLNTHYKIFMDNKIGYADQYPNPPSPIPIYVYYLEFYKNLAVYDRVFIMNHHRNYNLREISIVDPDGHAWFKKNEGLLTNVPMIRLSNKCLCQRDLDNFGPVYPPLLSWDMNYGKLNPEVLGNSSMMWYEDYDESWFFLNCYHAVKARLLETPEFVEDVSGYDGYQNYYSVTIKFEQDLMEEE
jgi:hypothetical protein